MLVSLRLLRVARSSAAAAAAAAASATPTIARRAMSSSDASHPSSSSSSSMSMSMPGAHVAGEASAADLARAEQVGAHAAAPGLSAGQLAAFAKNGFLVVRGFAGGEQLAQMQAAAERLVAGARLEGIPVFRAHDGKDDPQRKFAASKYFLESGDKVRVFLEEKALRSDGSVDTSIPKTHAVNKIGHALHELVPVFERFSFQERVAAILRSLKYVNPAIVQSMYIFKNPRIGGEVFSHQDNAFLWTEPPSLTGFWVAVHDANVANGCLHCIPGSHTQPITRRFVHRGNGVTEFTHPQPSGWGLENMVPLEAPAGTLVLLHGSLVHASAPNTSDAPRHAYSWHVAENDLPWAADNWMQRSTPFPTVYDRQALE